MSFYQNQALSSFLYVHIISLIHDHPMKIMKRQKDRTLKDELPRLVGARYANGDQWRNNSRKNEEMEPKQKQHQLWMWLVMEVKSNEVKGNIA